MTYAPSTIRELAAYWVDRGGESLGIVGDSAHAARATYHNGLDRAITRYGTTDMDVIASKDYSFRQPRDRSGASNAASALDLGRLNGQRQPMRDFSVWLVDRCRAGAPGTMDIREIIYSPDGERVFRWDGVDRVIRAGYPTALGQGDSSHLWHTHISFFRNSEFLDKLGLFRPYFEKEATLIITRTAFPGGNRRIVFKPGATAAGYVPRNGVLVEEVPSKTWTEESSAYAAYRVMIDGRPYYQMSTGYYAPSGSTYVPASTLIVPDPDPVLYTWDELETIKQAAITADRLRARVVYD